MLEHPFSSTVVVRRPKHRGLWHLRQSAGTVFSRPVGRMKPILFASAERCTFQQLRTALTTIIRYFFKNLSKIQKFYLQYYT